MSTASIPSNDALRVRLLVAALAFGLASVAGAADGRRELSQAGAGGTFPIHIGASGSYVLTSNLDLSAIPNESAISINAGVHDVSIDLNGFSIVGPCTGTPCAATSGNGIAGLSSDRVSVKNGTVRGMAGNGVLLGAGARLSDLVLEAHGADGAQLGDAAVLTRIVARANGQDGLDVDEGSTVNDCVAIGNADDGIEVDGHGTVVTRSSARLNGGHGIYASTAETVISECNVSANTGTGIRTTHASSILHNMSTSNTGTGIYAGSGSNLVENVSSGNGSHGIEVWDGVRLESNTIRSNGGSGVRVIRPSGTTETHLLKNLIHSNTGAGISQSSAGAGAATIFSGENVLFGNTPNVDILVTFSRVGCDRLAGVLNCP